MKLIVFVTLLALALSSSHSIHHDDDSLVYYDDEYDYEADDADLPHGDCHKQEGITLCEVDPNDWKCWRDKTNEAKHDNKGTLMFLGFCSPPNGDSLVEAEEGFQYRYSIDDEAEVVDQAYLDEEEDVPEEEAPSKCVHAINAVHQSDNWYCVWKGETGQDHVPSLTKINLKWTWLKKIGRGIKKFAKKAWKSVKKGAKFIYKHGKRLLKTGAKMWCNANADKWQN